MKKTLLGAAFLLATLLTFGINNASAEGHNVNFADGTDYKIVVNAPNPITSGTPVEKDTDCSIIITVTNDKKEVDKVTATGGVTLTQGADKNNWSFKMGEQIVDITVTLKDKATVAVEDAVLEAVAVYPNPFTNELYVAHTADVANVSLLNAQGIVVRTQLPNGAEQIRLAVEDLPAGLYMVVVEKDQAKKLFRVVK